MEEEKTSTILFPNQYNARWFAQNKHLDILATPRDKKYAKSGSIFKIFLQFRMVSFRERDEKCLMRLKKLIENCWMTISRNGPFMQYTLFQWWAKNRLSMEKKNIYSFNSGSDSLIYCHNTLITADESFFARKVQLTLHSLIKSLVFVPH
jgi:hypothetical protein